MQLMQLMMMLQGGGAELLHQPQINKNENNTSQRHASYSQLTKTRQWSPYLWRTHADIFRA